MNYYKRHLGDYAKDAGWLTTYQHGVYALLLDWYYSNERAIPVNLAYRIVRATRGPEKRAVDEVLNAFFDLHKTDGFAHHNRADFELNKYAHNAEVNSLIAKKRENTKRARNVQESPKNGDAFVNLATNPLTNKPLKDQKKGRASAPKLPEWLPADAWADWHTFRNARKGWTPKARALSLRTLTELHAAGHDPRRVIEQSIERGWTGLFPLHDGASTKPPMAQQFADKTYTGTPDDELPDFLRADAR